MGAAPGQRQGHPGGRLNYSGCVPSVGSSCTHSHDSLSSPLPACEMLPSWALHQNSVRERQGRLLDAQLVKACFSHPMVLLHLIILMASLSCACYISIF